MYSSFSKGHVERSVSINCSADWDVVVAAKLSAKTARTALSLGAKEGASSFSSMMNRLRYLETKQISGREKMEAFGHREEMKRDPKLTFLFHDGHQDVVGRSG